MRGGYVGGSTLLAAAVLCATPLASRQPSSGSTQTAPTPEAVRDRWNSDFAKGAPTLVIRPSSLLVSAVKERKPGTALDLGIGQGRNAIFLAEQGWDVTGVDISDVAVGQAKTNAAAHGVKVQAVVANLDDYDFGTERWDLITSFYMHSWHRSSPTEVPSRIYRALRPGGILVMEAFRRPPSNNGFVREELASAFSRFRILRNEEVVDEADWSSGEKRDLIRFVAEKPL